MIFLYFCKNKEIENELNKVREEYHKICKEGDDYKKNNETLKWILHFFFFC